MAVELDLYTVGNIETLSQVYKYLVLILGDSFIGTVIKITAVWGLIFAILASAFKGRFSIWIYHFLMTYVLFQIFFMPVVRLTIIDTKLDRTYVVDNVPFGVGFIASMASGFSYKLTNLIDNAFHTGTVVVWGPGTGSYVAGVDYSRMGFAGMFDYLKMGLKIDPRLVQTKFNAVYEMQAYIEQCFFPYLSTLTPTEIDKIRKSNNLLEDLEVDSSFLMNYAGITWTCDEFYKDKLVPDWNDFVLTASTTPQLLGFADYMTVRMVDSINAMTNASMSFNQIITQSGIINMIKESYFTSGLADDMNNRLLAGYAVGRAEEQAKLMGKAMFLWAKKVIPFMQGFLEAFFVILFPFLIILLFIPLVSFGGVQPAIGYLKVIVWVYLFIPILAIIDGMIKLQAINKTIAWLNSVGLQGITLGDYGFLLEQADFYPAIAGFAAMSTPLWAWMLLKGFEAGVHGISALVGSMGSQFVGQEAGAANITRNMTRDSRELMANMGAGQSPVEALSNAGTWMYKENTNLGGLYSSLGAYNAHSILESQLGIGGAVQTTTAQALYGLTHSGGRGMAAWNASGGNVMNMLNTGAMTSPAQIIERDYGTLGLKYDAIQGKLVAAEFNTGIKSDMMQANLQTTFSQSRNDVISTAWNAVWGNSQTYQKAYQSTYAITEQFLKDYTSGTGIEDRASFDNRAEVKQAFTDAQELRDTLTEEYGLSKDKATQFVAEFTTGLSAAAAKNGGKLDINTVKDVFKSVLSKFKADGSVDAKGIENFEETEAWKETLQYADNKSYQIVQDTALSYTTSHGAYFKRVKQEKGIRDDSVSIQDLQQFHENWQKAEQITAQINRAFNQTQTELGSLNKNNLIGFIRWMNGGHIDKQKETMMMDRILTAVANNDKPFLDNLSKAYTAYVMEMQGMTDVSPGVSKFFTQKQAFLNMVQGQVDNAAVNIATHFNQHYEGINTLRNMAGVSPYQNLQAEAGDRFAYVGSNQASIENGVYAGKGNIKPISKPPWTGEVERYTKDPTNPIELGKNIVNYGKEHGAWGTAMAVGTGSAILGTAMEYAPWAKQAFDTMKSGASKVWTTIRTAEPIAEMGTGRWAQFAAGGRLLTIPVGTTAGVAMAATTVPLAAVGGWAIGTAINNRGDDIYNNFTEPVLDWMGEKTGWWKPVGGEK